MKPASLSRRDVLKLALLGLGGLAWRPLARMPQGAWPFIGLARITIPDVPLHREADLRSPRVLTYPRDTLVRVLAEVVSPHGPPRNPRWYRVPGGFLHTAYTQRVAVRLNPVAVAIPPGGRVAEVTVPFTQSWQRLPDGSRRPLYRLYYGSTHWVTGVKLGEHGEPLYEITDDLLKVPYEVYAPHLRLIPPEEVAPLSPDVPPGEKLLEVDLGTQETIAYEAGQEVRRMQISSGIPSDKPTDNGIPTRTPSGRFRIFNKFPARHMGNGDLTSSLEAYELPGVPWVSFFVKTGVAFHGTYWHDNFGMPMSHGCINMRNADALWVFRWSTPTYAPWDFESSGNGTRVWVHE